MLQHGNTMMITLYGQGKMIFYIIKFTRKPSALWSKVGIAGSSPASGSILGVRAEEDASSIPSLSLASVCPDGVMDNAPPSYR